MDEQPGSTRYASVQPVITHILAHCHQFGPDVAFGTSCSFLRKWRISSLSAAKLLSRVQPSPSLLEKQRRVFSLRMALCYPVLLGA